MEYISVDKTKFPIIRIIMKKDEPSDEEFNDYLQTMYDIYSSNKGIVIIYDTRKSKYLKSKHRVKLGNWLKTNKQIINNAVLGVSYLVASPIGKIMLKGIFLVQKPIWKNKIVTSLDDAYAWANKLIEKNKTS